ncbi:MAG: hypothetical protein K5848_03280 [Lachnospiraceae bacterium]|nr:hypothetical protein [Lachnospiraceae bacterium]
MKKHYTGSRSFDSALHNFVSDTAYGAAVRRLYDAGLTVPEIKARLDFPASAEQIEKVIEDYKRKKASSSADYEYIKETDGAGRTSFRKVPKATQREPHGGK